MLYYVILIIVHIYLYHCFYSYVVNEDTEGQKNGFFRTLNDSSEIQIQVGNSPEPMFFPLNLIAKQSRWKNNDKYIFFNVYWYLVP